MMRAVISLLLWLLATVTQAQNTGIPASDTLGADDLWGNPSFIGGVAIRMLNFKILPSPG